MSKMKFDRKPPLAKSPVRLRPRRVLRSNSTSLQTPPGSLTKSKKLNPTWDVEEVELRPEYRSISCELRALARMVDEELRNGTPEKKQPGNGGGVSLSDCASNSSSIFERGRFYDEYTARRNERLKRKKDGEETRDKLGRTTTTTPYRLGVTVEPSKRRDSKKLESLKKSVSAAYSVERSEQPRYQLRSMSKENKKPPLAAAYNFDKSVLASERNTMARRVRKI